MKTVFIHNELVNPLVVSPLTDEAMYFEIGILIISGVLLALILRRHLQKHSEITWLLFLVFLNMTIAIFFIMLAKIYYLYFNADLLTETDPFYWFISRVLAYRFGFMFVTLAILCTQVFRVKVFDEKPAKWINYSLYFFGGFIMGWAMFVFAFRNPLWEIIHFALLFLYLLIVFIPFILKSFHSGRSTIVDVKFRRAFQYLGLMGICFIGVLLFNVFDQVAHFLDNDVSFSVFYFLGWITHLVAMLFAYFGFLRPKGQ